MCHSEDDDASCDFAVDDGEGKALEKHTPGIRRSRRPSMREGQRAGRCLFDRGGEASAKASLLLVVVDTLGEELTARSRYEPGRFHRDRRRASANTSSAA